MKPFAFSPLRGLMKLICTLLGLILGVMLFCTLYFQYSMGLLGFLTPEAEPGTQDSDVSQLLSQAIPSEKQINILLIGQDRRTAAETARSDSMILCTFNKSTKELILTSFLRDLYVPIPGYGSNRINAAYAFGGAALLRDTLEENFDLDIDGCVEVDFAQFSDIIDLLGGVQIQLRADEARLISQETGTSLSEGLQTLNGAQALSYARIRKLDADGDFSRTDRQRTVMSAVWDAYHNAGSAALLSLMKNVLPMLSTDLSSTRILGYAVTILPVLPQAQIVSQRIPADGQYQNTTIDGMSVLVADMDAAKEVLKQSLKP